MSDADQASQAGQLGPTPQASQQLQQQQLEQRQSALEEAPGESGRDTGAPGEAEDTNELTPNDAIDTEGKNPEVNESDGPAEPIGGAQTEGLSAEGPSAEGPPGEGPPGLYEADGDTSHAEGAAAEGQIAEEWNEGQEGLPGEEEPPGPEGPTEEEAPPGEEALPGGEQQPEGAQPENEGAPANGSLQRVDGSQGEILSEGGPNEAAEGMQESPEAAAAAAAAQGEAGSQIQEGSQGEASAKMGSNSVSPREGSKASRGSRDLEGPDLAAAADAEASAEAALGEAPEAGLSGGLAATQEPLNSQSSAANGEEEEQQESLGKLGSANALEGAAAAGRGSGAFSGSPEEPARGEVYGVGETSLVRLGSRAAAEGPFDVAVTMPTPDGLRRRSMRRTSSVLSGQGLGGPPEAPAQGLAPMRDPEDPERGPQERNSHSLENNDGTNDASWDSFEESSHAVQAPTDEAAEDKRRDKLLLLWLGPFSLLVAVAFICLTVFASLTGKSPPEAPAPPDETCQAGEWSEWVVCPAACGESEQVRERRILALGLSERRVTFSALDTDTATGKKYWRVQFIVLVDTTLPADDPDADLGQDPERALQLLAEKVKDPALPIYATLDGVLPGLEADTPFRLQAYKANREFKSRHSANFEYCARS
ncbi:thrombospondin type 1 domain-containing protein, putative [Eimeria necatrix]|uniref:Thrombospondin type 1 domain-containing protein, putative n=1 Tax=Eimeria necatrix TaxID=51315 RepID=U6MWN0_9EIME|nr:thrombospondin type 1 domain-containing protein, putative [Eimeria necatrix]CDJ68381.1 thrombospondin type 1 domain-containing protein, putative [Eimeria necatrix]